ncbi:hypothetical protein Plhal304r1_c015g0057051 [Plasmopara halstedii]
MSFSRGLKYRSSLSLVFDCVFVLILRYWFLDLCRVRDYPAITLDELNQYVEKQGPLYNPVFGEQPEFFIDEGFFTPYRMVVYGNAKVAAKITSLLDGWSRWSGHGGRVTTSQGAFILEQALDRKMRDEYIPHGVQLGWLIDPDSTSHHLRVQA